MSSMIHLSADGWCARVDDDAVDDDLARIADAAGTFWAQASPGAIVYVAFDTRPDAERLACLAGRILAGHGLVAKVADRFTPVPALAWTIANDQRACGGLMVTGSQRPYDYVGVRIYTADGVSPTREVSDELELLIEPEPASVFGGIQRTDIATSYLDNLYASVDGDAIARAGLSVLYDPLYGAGRLHLPMVMSALGIDVTEIHGEFDDDAIDLHPEPVEPWVDDCERAVVETGACAGFITDGDADRMSAVDERGRYVSPRMIATLVLKHLVEHRGEKGRVVLGVSASALTRRVAKALGCRVVMKPTGFEHIYKEALKGDVLLGVEGRTGICIPSHMIERDGLHVALILCELMAKTDKTLAQLVDEVEREYGAMAYAVRDLRVENEVSEIFRTMLPGLNPHTVAGREPVAVSHMDGLRLEFDDESWVLLRPSRMDPVVRVYAEAPTVQERDRLLEAGCEIARGEALDSGMQ